eukprot:12916840-Prorocentrum_lima.AAC.1
MRRPPVFLLGSGAAWTTVLIRLPLPALTADFDVMYLNEKFTEKPNAVPNEYSGNLAPSPGERGNTFPGPDLHNDNIPVPRSTQIAVQRGNTRTDSTDSSTVIEQHLESAWMDNSRLYNK